MGADPTQSPRAAAIPGLRSQQAAARLVANAAICCDNMLANADDPQRERVWAQQARDKLIAALELLRQLSR